MNEAPDRPSLYKMDPPFPGMQGGKILVSIGSKKPDIGTLMTYQPKGEGLFGVKIRFEWGTSAMQAKYWDCPLSEDEIRSIKEADHQDYKFTIELPEGG
jgi:hypothetical protein